jgi:hypothetical protein
LGVWIWEKLTWPPALEGWWGGGRNNGGDRRDKAMRVPPAVVAAGWAKDGSGGEGFSIGVVMSNRSKGEDVSQEKHRIVGRSRWEA